ncbi:TonB-dependent siderophore receptor [Xylophilus sp. GOD-11R]|uniref:TonB-dependent siderophore receptor n=1 Tax=Xylophilus sp. GOD-11R TaxID=3089814 RepID=UPI00298CDD82|nr:TonB-dependent siderophore receptor [Xylophilus sp. GOD-11R]WPB56094.1 TonB-dependent siderophore receptor [Xylophilus sp. GOD-11R]
MPSTSKPRLAPSAWAIHLALLAMPAMAQTTTTTPAAVGTLQEVKVLGTAEEELKQAPGVSTITAEDIEKRPPANDLSEIIRTMPGVNLTGNSASGQYGNNRQIDLRGMGPENTLILIDGKPVASRNSVRMGRSGERNTRGDTNWVPAESVERIEVLRGPAAARYGSGAAGGVVNIITKAPGKTFAGSVTAYTLLPQHSDEGNSSRLGFNLSGPLADKFSFRLFGNVAKTDADSLGLNATSLNTAAGAIPPAGREGVRNRDINGLVRWDLAPGQVLEFEAGFSRQGNIYAGDRAVSATGTALTGELAAMGAETNTMYRQTAAITHRGNWSFGTSRTYLQYEGTRNSRLNEGLAGGPEGSIGDANAKSTSVLDNYSLLSEVNMPMKLGGFDQVLTTGIELRQEKLDDPYSMSQSTGNGGAIPGLASNRDGKASADNVAFFMEDNIQLNSRLILTPGVRLDRHSQFGTNVSPSLNASYKLTPEFTLKGGIARAFKAPNLYQSNPNYLYYTRGNGCPNLFPSLGAGCYVQGNADLDPETSVNKEIGIAWNSRGYAAGITYFHNDYKNKIVAGMVPVGNTASNGRILQWTNAPKAIVQGFEGNLTVPVTRAIRWSNNFTYMIENEDKTTGEPLSVIPRYTVNTLLDWQVSGAFSMLFTGTFYGKQEPRNLTQTGAAATGAALAPRDAYSLWGISANYDFTAKTRVRVGVNNIFDKRLFREAVNSSAGAATYNEPGRSVFVNLTSAF